MRKLGPTEAWTSAKPPDTGDVAPCMSAARVVWLGPVDMMERLPIAAILQTLPDLPPRGACEQVGLEALADRITVPRLPDAILSPLFWRDGDVMEAASLLMRLTYRGVYRVISPELPSPDMVEREVRQAYPGLDFALIPLPPR